MARVYSEGFEFASLLCIAASSGTPTFSAGTVRSGTYALSLVGISADLNLEAGYTEFYARVCLRVASGGAYVRFRDNAAHQCFGIFFDNATPVVRIINSASAVVASSTNTWAYNTWYVLEVYYNSVGSTISVRVDGDAWVSVAAALTYTSCYFLRLETTGGTTTFFDDIAVNDPTGAEQNSWPGDGHIVLLLPDGIGSHTDLTPSAAVDNYTLVDEVPNDGDTTYVSGAVDTNYDQYAMATLTIPANHVIAVVWTKATARAESAGADGLLLGVRTEGTDFWSAKKTLGTAYTEHKGVYYSLNPQTGLAWTQGELDAVEVGVQLTA
jgi:hypothetical protein